jgi:hypothetical protein
MFSVDPCDGRLLFTLFPGSGFKPEPHDGFYPQNSAGRSHGDSNPNLEPDKLPCNTFTLWDHWHPSEESNPLLPGWSRLLSQTA